MAVGRSGLLRADARRNHEAIVAAAIAAFDAVGLQVPLDDVAKSAGVGNATLYRHFPTRDALVFAALENRLADLGEVAQGLLSAEDPGAALDSWLLTLAAYLRAWDGLPRAIQLALDDRSSPLAEASQAIRDQTASLLARAQGASGVRADVQVDDICSVVASIASAADARGDSEEALLRMVRIVSSGVRA